MGEQPVEEAVAAARAQAPVVRAAGGVIWDRDGEVMRVALVHRPAYDDWTFPKGKLEAGERLETAALREVEEETGLRCLIDRCLGTLTYLDRRGRDKVVWYWSMRVISGSFAPTREVDELRWLTASDAGAMLSYEHDRVLLTRAAE
jgi:8-oxo-dGTP diphosphatase